MQCVWNVLLDPLRNQPHDKLACSTPHPNPLVDRELAKKQQHHHQQQQQQQFQLKRKRTNSLEVSPSKRSKNDSTTKATAAPNALTSATPTSAVVASSDVLTHDHAAPAPSPVKAVSESVDRVDMAHKTEPIVQHPTPSAKPDELMDVDVQSKARTRAHERIEANINLQILLKHDELRLIEQELGKCQIALEQLRRCHVIPYPGQPGSQTPVDNIVTGTGAALKPPPGYNCPDYPAPFGVTDGPYSRHYAQWLIPDSAFDPDLPRQPRASVLSQAGPGRSTRGSYDMMAGYTTPRVGRPSIVSQNAAGQNNYSVPRDRHAPLMVPRPSDGQLVKVVCKICGKKDSANVQGFTNHCRIAHGINYASHSDAINECGQPVGNDEMPQSTAPTPVESKPMSIVTTPQQVQPRQPVVDRPMVHPLITAPVSDQKLNLSVFNGASRPLPKAKSNKKSGSKVADNFTASSSQPHLSALLKKRGFEGDLKALVTSAQQKIDLDQISPLVSEDEEEEPNSAHTPTSTSSTPSRPLAKPKSRRGNMSGVRIPTRAPIGPSRLQINTSSNMDMENHSLCDSPIQSSATATPAAETGRTSTSTSPMDIDGVDGVTNGGENGSSSANLSPHTADTMPGLVTDNEDEPDYVDSEQEGSTNDDETRQRSLLVDIGVRVRDADENSQQGDDMIQPFDATTSNGDPKKSSQNPDIPPGVVSGRSNDIPAPTHQGSSSSTPRKRGRPRKNSANSHL